MTKKHSIILAFVVCTAAILSSIPLTREGRDSANLVRNASVSVDGIHLGESAAQLQERLGLPNRTEEGDPQIHSTICYWNQTRVEFSEDLVVLGVVGSDLAMKGQDQVSTGDSRQQVKRALQWASSRAAHPDGANWSFDFEHCIFGTVFEKDGRVARVWLRDESRDAMSLSSDLPGGG